MICKNCAREINEESLFCPYCGEQQKEEIKEIKNKEFKYRETSEFNLFTKILFVITGAVLILTFLPYNKTIPLIALGCSSLLFIASVIFFIKNRSKYNMLLVILNIVLVLSNINSIVLYNILL